MPIETAIVVACIVAAFTGFAVVLAWADRHTASHTMPMYDPRTGEWDGRFAEFLAPVSMLPSPG